ncbi:MAG: hypothetical protein IJ757_03280 [Clostridiales bacterium]|nr:hypothetical protein [Clostridiales bacterium]
MFGMSNDPDNFEAIMSNNGSSASDSTNGRLDKLETMIHAFWLLFQQKGYTNEMLDEALTQALAEEAMGRTTLKGMACPGCGRKAQFSGHFKIKCIYCGMEAVLNPYEASDIARQMDEELAKQQSEEEQKQRWNEAVKSNPYQPYDVTQDLGFDDFDDGQGM